MSGGQRVTSRAIVLAFLAALCTVKVADGLHGGPGVVGAIAAVFLVQLPYVVPRAQPFRARHWAMFLAVQALLTYLPFAVFGSHWVAGVSGLLGGSLLLALPGRVSWLAFGAVVAAETALGITVLHFTGPADICYLITATAANGLSLYGLVRLAGLIEGRPLGGGRPAARAGPGLHRAMARMVIVALCCCHAVQTVLEIRAYSHVGGVVLAAGALVTAAIVLLQLHHSMPRSGTPEAWPWTITLQALLMLGLASIAGWPAYTMAGLVAGSVLLLVRAPWSLLPGGLILAGGLLISPPTPLHLGNNVHLTAAVVAVGLAVYGLSRFAELTVRLPARPGATARPESAPAP